MQTKHTPGPWSVIHNSWEVSTVYGHDDSVVAKCPIDSGVDELTQDHLESLMEANARLIAAAPYLLKALVAVLAVISDARADDDVDCTTSAGGYLLGDVMNDAFYDANAAIAKATGGAA